MLAAACGSPPAPPPPDPQAGSFLSYAGRIGDGGAPITVRLIGERGEPAASVLRVHRIEIRRRGAPAPMQTITGLDTETPTDGREVFEMVDMNFDGLADFRIMERAPAGPSTPYLNFLFDPATSTFVGSPELDALSAPVFDAARRRIVSTWRDGAARYGTDVYELRDGRPVLVRREVREHASGDAWESVVWERVDGTLRVVERARVGE